MPNPQLQTLKRKRASFKGQLSRFDTFVTNFKGDCAQLKARLEQCKKLWYDFDELQVQIEMLEESDEENTNSEERAAFEDSYYHIVSKASIILESNSTSLTSAQSTQNVGPSPIPGVKFPKIDLPVFSGNYEEFMTFHDSFNALINNNATLTNIERFHYLRSALKGEAAHVISGIETTSQNYQVAWQLLQDRYDNRRLIIHNHVRAIFELSSLNRESHIGLRQLLDNLNKHLRALEALKEPVDKWDTLLIYLVCSKLDNTTRREWETFSEPLTTPTMKDFTDFLNKRYNLLQTISYKKHDTKPSPPQFPRHVKHDTNKDHSYNYLSVKACVICKQAHKISTCDKFLNLSPRSRYLEIKKFKLCANCLGGGHSYQSCTVENNCRVCNKKHHLLLHFKNSEDTGEQGVKNTSSQNKSVSAHTTFKDDQVLLSTAIVFIFDLSGKKHKCKVLLDSGSQSNFITKELCERLQLPKQTVNIPISGLSQACTNVSQKTQTTIKSVYNNFKADLSFLVVNQITDNLPINHINLSNIQIPTNINLADPLCNVPSEIDALLGASIFWNLLCIGQIKLSNTQILAQKTKLGWILSGQVANICNNSSKTVCHLSLNLDLQKQLERFWQIEHCESRPMWSSEQKACEANFASTHKHEANGRFSVQLPLKHAITSLGESRQMALKRFNALEKRLHNNTILKSQYVNFMDEYHTLGHMSEVDSDAPGLNYLPHSCVFKESSSTTKVRVVFDASAKTESGMSLNDVLMTGPTIQQDLFSILLRFRKHQYAVTADCAKMYRQINVESNQRHLQAILWRNDEKQPLTTFTLNTVTYGTSCAPFLAVRCLHQLAEENASRKPQASNIIKQDFYVDDLISGADTIEGALQIKREVTEILSQGQFELRKWRSNHPSIIQENPNSEHLEFSENKESKTLGLVWNSQNDKFLYNLQIICTTLKYVTKRTILSFISKIFDPLGLIGPIIIKAKILLQQLWQLSLDRDESVPLQIYTSWKIYQEQMQSLENISVPRHVLRGNPIRIEVHTFCDASETSYGACIYIRSLDNQGGISSNLLCAKSRVAPLKVLSLPRLELCGALLAARLSSVVDKSLNLHIDQWFSWCDFSITLTWILDEPYKWKTFVGNRVAEVQELTDEHSWRHIRSEDNPADIISRGINPSELRDAKLWWHGPSWLERSTDDWPVSMPIKIAETPERKTTSKIMVTTQPDLSLVLKFSSFLRLQRVVAYILRFENNSLKRSPQYGPLTCQELELSMKSLLKLAQSQCFAEEERSLINKTMVGSKSKLKNLNPFLDNDGLLRVGGRLKRSNLDYDFKHPIILPKGHIVTKLLITYEHRKLLHAGPQALLAHIRTRFWPIAGRNEVRKVLKECVVCFKVKPTTVNTLLGQLPDKRVTPSRPFLNCAVDYAGPFYIKVGLARSKQLVKAYLCVFICLCTKALHLELVIDLSSNAFLNAFKRFIARRGKCQHIYSDNGTNFVGANHELTTFFNQSKNQTMFADFFAVENITWHFIPPRSPHFGGIWESAVKSVKYHLRRVIGKATLTYEEFNTILVQVEACLNSRPLSPLSTDPDDFTPLTSGHFLIGSPLTAVPEPDLRDTKTGRLTRYQHLTQIMQHFWKRWSKDYLTEVQQRAGKGASPAENLTIGKMVFLVDDNLPPLQWSLGRVVNIHPGLDGIVRVVTVKTAKGLFTRAVRKEQSHKSYRPLCVLTFRLNYLFGQLEPLGYHLVNMMLHSVVCLMYFRMCSMFLPDIASFVAAMLFSVHPIHTEAVTGVVGRAETLSSVFFLAAFLFYSKATKNRKCTEWKYVTLSMLSIATAMLCKEQGITIAGVCAAYEIFVIQKVKLEDIKLFLKSAVTSKSSYHLPKSNAATKRLLVLCITTILLLLARLQIMGSQLPVFTRFDNPASVAPSPTRQLTYHYLISVNLWLLLFPCNLCCDWTMGTIPLVESFLDPRNLTTVATYVFLLAMVGTAFTTENRHQSVVLIMSTSLLVLPFMPASNLFFPVGFVVAERVLYMPSMGFCMLIGYGWQILCRKAGKKLAWTLVCLLILSHGAKTYLRNWDWENEYTIFMSGLRVNQRNAKLFNNVGHALESQGNFEDALQFFKTAVSVQHDDVGAYINVGRTYNHLKMYKEAEDAYLKAKSLLPKAKPGESYQARIAPNHLNVFLNLANLISKNHTRLEEADMLYRQAISMRADYTQAYINRGDILIKLNRTKEAQEVYERALLYDSNNPDIYYNLGVVFLEQGKASQALAYLDKALEIDPEHEQALLNSAILLQEFGRPEFRKTARERLLKLLAKDKNNERVHFNLGMLAMDDKDISEAEHWFRRAVHLKADFRSALFNLALLLADDMRPLEAAPFLNQLVKYHPDHVKGLILLGDIYINNIKDLDAAENCYKRILELEPDNIQGLHNLCVVHVERGKMLEAQSCLEEAHRLAPEEDYIIKHLSIVQNRIAKLHLNEDIGDTKEKSKVVSNKSVDENEKTTQPVISKDTEKQRYSSRVVNTEPLFVNNIDNINEYPNLTIESEAATNAAKQNSSKPDMRQSGSDKDDPSSGMS